MKRDMDKVRGVLPALEAHSDYSSWRLKRPQVRSQSAVVF